MHDDLQMMRQLEMEKCFQDRQIPCRWVPDMGFGYGFPLFNFYPPLPYYLGQIFRWLGFSFINTVKLVFSLQFFLSGLTMFILAADLWGLWGGLLAGVFYIWAPYHSVDVFVRGAMNEAWAFVWFPLIFWAAKKLIEKEEFKYLLWLSFSFAMLLLSHSVMVMIFTPLLLIWVFYWLLREKKLSRPLLAKLAFSGLWALGLAAFFALPMFFERQATHIETMFSGYFDWRAHFVSLNQLFISRFWGWGPSLWQEADGMAFPAGQIHWLLALAVVFLAGYRFIKNRKKQAWDLVLILGLSFLALFYLFLNHQRSIFIWKIIPPLQLAQFPWRLLSGAAFLLSLISGSICLLLKKKWFIFPLLILVIAWNWNFFRPEKMGPLTDEEKFSGKAWEFQQTAGIYDYLPRTSPKAPISAPESGWWFFEGEAEAKEFKKKTNSIDWIGEVKEPGVLQVSGFCFPGWKVWVKYQEKELLCDPELGRMQVKLDQGLQKVHFHFTKTPIRAWADLISLISWGGFLIVLWPKKRKWI